MIHRVDNKVAQLLPAPVTLTGSWQDLGSAAPGPNINVMDCLSLSLWLKVDINDSQNLRIRMLGLQADGATDLYDMPILEVGAANIKAQGGYVELNVDVDQNIILSFPTVDQVPVVKFQVQVGTVGATAGQIVSAGISFKSNSPFGG